MPVITMKVPCTIENKGAANLFGKQTFGAPRKSVCAIVKLRQRLQHTTVRTDSSGSHGHADEAVVDGVLLLKKDENIKAGDILTVNGLRMRVTGITFRYTAMSKLDHLEVETKID